MAEYEATSAVDTPTPPAPETPAPMPVPKHSEAGRRAAERVKQLIRMGQRYEEEHGLKRGRQRLRQLIQLGKRYEIEKGLAQRPKPRPRRAKAWADFVRSLGHVVRPAYQRKVELLVESLTEKKSAPQEQKPAAK